MMTALPSSWWQYCSVQCLCLQHCLGFCKEHPVGLCRPKNAVKDQRDRSCSMLLLGKCSLPTDSLQPNTENKAVKPEYWQIYKYDQISIYVSLLTWNKNTNFLEPKFFSKIWIFFHHWINMKENTFTKKTPPSTNPYFSVDTRKFLISQWGK